MWILLFLRYGIRSAAVIQEFSCTRMRNESLILPVELVWFLLTAQVISDRNLQWICHVCNCWSTNPTANCWPHFGKHGSCFVSVNQKDARSTAFDNLGFNLCIIQVFEFPTPVQHNLRCPCQSSLKQDPWSANRMAEGLQLLQLLTNTSESRRGPCLCVTAA